MQDADRLNMEFQKDRLIDLIESEFGLLDKLLSCGALKKAKIAEIKSGTTLYKKNEFLLNYIFSGNKHKDLMKALSDCGQHHIVNWVKGNGEYKEEFGLDWPLREAEEKVLDCNQEALVDLLNADDLLTKLFSMEVINNRQRQSIVSKPTEYERSEALLDAVRRFSLKSYFAFKECLRQSGQSHVADILENGGFVVPVHATLKCENLDEVETQIVNEMENVLMEKSSVEQADRLVAALQLRVIATRRGKSIVSYISCIKEEEFIHLCKIIDNLEMRSILEQLFNMLNPYVKIKVLLVNISSKDMEKAQGIFKDMTISWVSKENENLLYTISDLSLELIDVILAKSYLFSIQRQRDSLQNQTDEMVIKQLASVDFCWFQRITRRRFKNVVWSKLKKYYEDKCTLYLICKYNQQFCQEVPQISGKTNKNLSTDYLKGKRSSRKRQIEYQMPRTTILAPEIEDSVLEDFFNCRKYKEYISAIMNAGGGTARVEMKMSRPLTEFELIPQQLECNKMWILRSFSDRDAVVWIWCLSNNALQKLNNRDIMKKLIEIVQQSVKATSNIWQYKTNIDYDHLKKKIVSIPFIFADFRATLNFERETLRETRSSASDKYRVIDVTKLKLKIYVLCLVRSSVDTEDASLSTMICVFEDRSPCPIVEDILLRRFDSYSKANTRKRFGSIVSSVKGNCLYLLTSSEKENHFVDEVIRFEIKENEENSLKHPSKWLELEKGYRPSAISMCRGGDLMMVNRTSPIILRIYNSDARLRLSVTLHDDILEARKAVETSNGNFIVLHSMKRKKGDADVKSRRENEDDAVKEEEKEEEESFGSSPSDDSICSRLKERDVVYTVSEVSHDGKTTIRRFIPQNQQHQLSTRSFFYEGDLCTDAEGRVFVTDPRNQRVIVLDCYFRWIGHFLPQFKKLDEEEKLHLPSKLFYDEESNEMIVAGEDAVQIYDKIFN